MSPTVMPGGGRVPPRVGDDEALGLVNSLIDDLRGHKMTRFGGGSCVVDFKLTRADAIDRVREFIREFR